MSGITVHDDVLAEFEKLKIKKEYAALVLCMSPDNTKVVVDKTYPADTAYDAILKELPEQDCRYLIYDFKYEIDGCQKAKLTLILWAPAASKTKSKMLYASTKSAVMSKLEGMQEYVYATDYDEAGIEEIINKIKK